MPFALGFILILVDDYISGATVYLVCRNKERGEAALSEIQSTTGNQNVHLEVHSHLVAYILDFDI